MVIQPGSVNYSTSEDVLQEYDLSTDEHYYVRRAVLAAWWF